MVVEVVWYRSLKIEEDGATVIPVTDERMTRFWITLDQGVQFVIDSLERMKGGEIFIPKIPSMNILDFAKAIAPECTTEIVGIRPGEKLHEAMITEDDARHTLEYADHFVIQPEFPWWSNEHMNGGTSLPEGFTYISNVNDDWLSVEDLRALVTD